MASIFNKKASLNLSVQAIVIVVIAFVVLGLGLGFVRGQFEQMEATSSSVQEQISQQILDDLRTGNKKLSFPATSLSLETKELDVQAIGVKNTEDSPVNLVISFSVKGYETLDKCKTVGQPEEFVPFKSGKTLKFYTQDDTGNCGDVDAKIDWDDSVQTLGQGESRVYPVSITAPSSSDNYLFKTELIDQDNLVNPIFDSKTFFIRTN